VTVLTWGKITNLTLEACEELGKDAGIEAQVIDLRTLTPLDEDLIFSSVAKTNRVVIVEENWPFSSVGSEIADRIQRECFDHLDGPVFRVSQEPVPVPYAHNLEERALISKDRIKDQIKKALL
jgi:pyruvate dehydrogenase E1 component beta subunit